MFEIFGKGDFSDDLAEHLLTFTYLESSVEIIKSNYIENQHDISTSIEKKAQEKFRKDYFEFISDFLSSEEFNQFIAAYRVDRKIVSALRIIEMESGVWLEEALETAPECRRNGYSFKLVEKLIESVRERNGKVIVANIGRSNKASRNLHIKLGFRETTKLAIDESGNVFKNQVRYEYRLK